MEMLKAGSFQMQYNAGAGAPGSLRAASITMIMTITTRTRGGYG
jgi:hypothetical protein